MITNDDEDGHGLLENGGSNHRYQETDKPQNRGSAFKTCYDSSQKCYKFHLVPSCGKMIPYKKY